MSSTIIIKLHFRCDPPVYQYLLFVLIFEHKTKLFHLSYI
jgi:hypothetical protein